MSGERNADLAVSALLDFYETNLQTYLTQVETDQGLTTGEMTPPVDYVAANLPNDNRSPLFECWCDSSSLRSPESTCSIHAPYENKCNVALSFSSDADIEEGQIKARRYMTALNDVLTSDRTLGGTVVLAMDVDHNYFNDIKANATTRHSVIISINVITMGDQ